MSWGAGGIDGGGFVGNGSSGRAVSLQRLNEDEQTIYDALKQIYINVNDHLITALRDEFITGKTPRQITMVYKKNKSTIEDPSDGRHLTSEADTIPGTDFSNNYIVIHFVCRPFAYGTYLGNMTSGFLCLPYMSIYYIRKDYKSQTSDREFKKGQYWMFYYNGTTYTESVQLDSLDYLTNSDNYSEITTKCIENIHECLIALKDRGHNGTNHFNAWLAINKLTDIMVKLHE
jgi:hypothetical protein